MVRTSETWGKPRIKLFAGGNVREKGKRGSITNFIDRVSFVSGSSIHLLNLDALLDHLVRALFDHQPPPPPQQQQLLLLPLLLLQLLGRPVTQMYVT